MDKQEKIIAALRANKIEFDEDFKDLVARGYASDACQAFSEEIVDDIEKLVVAAINQGGFTAKSKEAIADLIRLTLKLSDRKAADKLVKFRDQKEKIVASVPKTDRKEGKMNIREEALKYIQTSRKGAEAVLAMKGNASKQDRLRESIELLNKTEEVVLGAWDNVSKNAADRAEEMIGFILKWRRKLSVYMCDGEAVENLRSALEKAKEWESLKEAPKKKEIADDKYLEERVKYLPDSVDRIIASSQHIEQIGAFCDALEEFDEVTKRRYNTDKMEEECNALYKKSEEKTAEMQSLAIRYKNGEIKAEQALPKMRRLKTELEDISELIKTTERDLERASNARMDREGIRREFTRLNDKIMEYDNDHAMLTTLARNIDFVELSGVLLGRVSPDQMRAIVNRILGVFDMIKLHGGFTEEVRESWRDIRRELNLEDSQREERRRPEAVKNDKEKEKAAEAEMDALLGELGMNGGSTEQEKKKADEEIASFIPLSDSDK